MPIWEYHVAHCQLRDLKKKQVVPDLDPALQQVSGHYWLIFSLNGYYTSLSQGLNELGQNGWEVVGTTPPLQLPSGGTASSTYTHNSAFFFIFKRLRIT
jgi:hypothetical protein